MADKLSEYAVVYVHNPEHPAIFQGEALETFEWLARRADLGMYKVWSIDDLVYTPASEFMEAGKSSLKEKMRPLLANLVVDGSRIAFEEGSVEANGDKLNREVDRVAEAILDLFI